MAIQHTLFLHEEIMLLALRDAEGTIAQESIYKYALGGAVLAELLLHKRIGVMESKKKRFVTAVSSKSIGEPLLDECLERISRAKRPTMLPTWVSRFAGMK